MLLFWTFYSSKNPEQKINASVSTKNIKYTFLKYANLVDFSAIFKRTWVADVIHQANNITSQILRKELKVRQHLVQLRKREKQSALARHEDDYTLADKAKEL